MRELHFDHPWRDRFAVIAPEPEEARALLSAGEVVLAATFAREARQREWMAARAAGKLVLLRRQSGSSAPLIGYGEESGRSVIWSQRSVQPVSFTHSHEFGGAMVDDDLCGIDLERVRPVEPRLAKFFLRGAESELVDLPIEAAMIHLWAAKEAAFKMFGTATLLSEVAVSLIECNGAAVTLRAKHGERSGEVITARNDAFVLAAARFSSTER